MHTTLKKFAANSIEINVLGCLEKVSDPCHSLSLAHIERTCVHVL